MSPAPFCEETDLWENSYFHYLNSVRALASSPADTCDLYDDFNVAGELWLEIRQGIHLSESSKHRLSQEQIALIGELVAAIGGLPPEATAYTQSPPQSLLLMNHPSWEKPRELAGRLLAALEHVSKSNLAYINSPKAI